jgi:hypothetical protein
MGVRVVIVLVVGAAVLPVLSAHAATRNAGPTLLAAPKVAGVPTQGARLTGSLGRWKGSEYVLYSFQWYRCDTMGAHCSLLRGVTRKSRVVGPADVGHTLSFAVRATDSTGTRTAYASLVGPVAGTPATLTVRARPTVSGDSVLGATVKVDPGRWQPEPAGFSFQWARCNSLGRSCIPIGGATGDTHEIAAADLGHPIVAIVQAKTSTQTRAVFSSATPAAVAKRTAPKPPAANPPRTTPPPAPAAPTPAGAGPTVKSPPTVANTVQQGKKLSASAGSWAGSGAISYAYQW